MYGKNNGSKEEMIKGTVMNLHTKRLPKTEKLNKVYLYKAAKRNARTQ